MAKIGVEVTKEQLEHAVEATENVDAEELEKAVEETEYQDVNYKVQVGIGAKANTDTESPNSKSVAIGWATEADKNETNGQSIAVGERAKANYGGIAVGSQAKAPNQNAIAVGVGSEAGNQGIAIGVLATATQRAVQIGFGTNNTPNTLQYKDITVINANGKIPSSIIEGGGGGGGSLFVATYTESEGTYTCDKTLAQILSAIADGNIVVADFGGTQYSLTMSGETFAVFSCVLQESGSTYLLTIHHDSQEITVSQEQIGGGATYTAGQNISINNGVISAGMETIIV